MDCSRLRDLLAAAEISTKTALDLVQAGASAAATSECLAQISGRLVLAQRMLDEVENAAAVVNGTARDNIDQQDPDSERGNTS